MAGHFPRAVRRASGAVRRALALCAGLLGPGLSAPAAGESAFALPYPSETGRIEARAYGPEGRALPVARLAAEPAPGGELWVRFEAGDPQGALMRASARLAPLPGHEALRLLEERSVSYASDGKELRTVVVDHAARRARCLAPGGRVVEEVELEARDRIVNVPLNLFFLPLVRGERERLEFQLFLCRDGARRVDFEAWVESTDDPRGVRVRYGPDFGLASALARRFAPDLAFWFDPVAPHDWRGHRLPLYTDGPEVLVLRPREASIRAVGDGSSP